MEMLAADYVTYTQLDALISTHEQRWRQTPERARLVREMQNGDMATPIPEAFRIADAASACRVDTPHKYLVPYHQTNLLARDVPRLERFATGEAKTLQLEATRIEQILQAVMEDERAGLDWYAACDIALNEGCVVNVVMPEPAAFSRESSLYEIDPKTGLQDSTRIRTRYQRSADGKTADEYGKGFRPAKGASDKVRKAEQRDYLSRNIPIVQEILGPQSILPIFGPSYTVDILIVRRQWTLTEFLKKKLFFSGMQGHLSPDGPSISSAYSMGTTNTSAGQSFEVIELYATDYQDDGPHPYVAYAVRDGSSIRRIQKRDGNDIVDHIIDLRDEYGLERQPFVFEFGPYVAHPDPDKRARPFPLPFQQSWRAIDAIMTGAAISGWWSGFPMLIEEPGNSPDFDLQKTTPDDDEDDNPIGPLKLYRSKGPIKQLQLQTMDDGMFKVVEFLAGANKEEGPPEAALGSGGQSGFQASLARAYSEDAMAQVKKNLLHLFSQSAEIAFEELTGMANRFGTVPIQRLTEVPLGRQVSSGQQRRQILELTKDLAGNTYDLNANWPPIPNLALAQQYAEFVKNRLVLRSEFREKVIGDEHPEVFEAELLVQDLSDGDQGKAQTMALAAQIMGNDEMRQQMKDLADGAAMQSMSGGIFPEELLQGLASAATTMAPPPTPPSGPPGLPPPSGPPGMAPGSPGGPPAPPPGAMTGAGPLPNPGQMSLAGQMGGTIGAATKAAAAGGVVPGNLDTGGSV
jgi:hypothetical protein